MSNVTAIRTSLPVDSSTGEERYLSPEQVVEMVPGLSIRTLREWRAANRQLPWVQLSPKRVAYLESDVRAFVMSHRQPVRERS